MRHRFEDSCNMNILNWKLYRKINTIRTWSSRKVEFLSEINLNTQIIYFQFKEFYVPFMTLQSIGFNFFAKIMKGSCVFGCSTLISFNSTSHFKTYFYLWSVCTDKLISTPEIMIFLPMPPSGNENSERKSNPIP